MDFSDRAYAVLMNDTAQFAGDTRLVKCHALHQGDVETGGARVATQIGEHYVIRVKASDITARPARGSAVQLTTAGAMTIKDIYTEGNMLAIVATASARRAPR